MKLLVVDDRRCTLDALLAALGPLSANVQVLASGEPLEPPSYLDLGLSLRQAQVLALLCQGKPTKVICRELQLAEGTVKIHITRILKALKVSNRTQAVIEAGRLGVRLPEGTCAPGAAR